MADSSGSKLTTAECWQLVESEDLARLAVIRADGTPDLFPINYTVHAGNVYLRTGSGEKLRNLTAHPTVAFEVDGIGDTHHWSVVIRGTATEIQVDSEIASSGVRAVSTADPTHKPHFVRLNPTSITGRRFPKDAPRAAAPRGARHDAPLPPVPPTGPGKPQPIPHFPPPPSS